MRFASRLRGMATRPEDFPHASLLLQRTLFTPLPRHRLPGPYLNPIEVWGKANDQRLRWSYVCANNATGKRRLDSFNSVCLLRMQSTWSTRFCVIPTRSVWQFDGGSASSLCSIYRLLVCARCPKAGQIVDGGPKALCRAPVRCASGRCCLGQAKRTFTLPWDLWMRGPTRRPVFAGLGKSYQVNGNT